MSPISTEGISLRGTRVLRGVIAGLALAFASAGFAAPPVSGTLARLKTAPRISLGANDDAPPLAYLGADSRHIGFHLDICERVVAAVARRLELPRIDIVSVTTTQATRLALLNNGTIDIACGHNPISQGGLQQARFSHATLMVPIRAMTTADRASLTLAGIGGLKVITAVGGQAIGRLRAHLRNSSLQVTTLAGRTVPEMFGHLESGRGDVLLLPEYVLLTSRAGSATPERYVLTGDTLGTDPVALMFRTGDDELADLANDVVGTMMRSGEMEGLYRKWFQLAIPGLKLPVGLELSEATRALYRKPGSEMEAF